MADTLIEVLPQPRIDTLVTDASTGGQRRRTEYTGTIWFGGRPQADSYASRPTAGFATIESPLFLPDSLPYRPDPEGDAQTACTVAIQGAEDGYHQILDYRAGLVPDPRNDAVCWIQVQISALARTPLAIAYRVVVLAAPDAILATAGSGQA